MSEYLTEEELKKRRCKQARKLDRYLQVYHVDGLVDDYIPFLKSLVIRERISVDKVLGSMPLPELVKSDREQLHRLMVRTRCLFSCMPISYALTEMLAKGEDLFKYGERLYYDLGMYDKPIEALFTVQEFIDSTQEFKTMRLLKK